MTEFATTLTVVPMIASATIPAKRIIVKRRSARSFAARLGPLFVGGPTTGRFALAGMVDIVLLSVRVLALGEA